MAVSGPQAVRKFRKLFLKLGAPEGTASLRAVIRGESVFGPSTIEGAFSLWRVIPIDDYDQRAQLGVTDVDMLVIRCWGGLFGGGLYSAGDAMLRRCKQAGGTLTFLGRDYKMVDFQAGFSVQGYVTSWYLKAMGDVEMFI